MTILQKIKQDWTWLRFFRLVIGITLSVNAIIYQEILTGIVASFVLFQAFANVGCCGGSSCSVDYKKQ